MASELAEAIRVFEEAKGIPHDLVIKTIEGFMLAAYKKKYGTTEGVEVKFNEDESEVILQVKKKIVDDVIDEGTEIDIEDALKYDDNCEIGDELIIDIDPKTFDRMEVQSAKQHAKQKIREIKDDTLYTEYIDKVGEMIVGYYQREHNGNIFVDLGKTEGILPKRYQSPRETYKANDRIKALIYEVEKNESNVNIILSRTHTDFVKKLFELEVPEIADKTIEIFKIVREPGYRVKMAVFTHRDDIDPVGACVGLKGARIQSVVREMEGEKIDVLKYDTDPKVYIKNALSPAEVLEVYILDQAKRQALAVVNESQLSLAIGKQGLNVRLANRLVDWNIDVKTEEQFQEMDIYADVKKKLDNLFTGDETQAEEPDEEITKISELPGIPEKIVNLLTANDIVDIETFLSLSEKKLLEIEGFTKEDFQLVNSIIEDNVEIVDDMEPEESDSEAEDDEFEDEYEYECPECGKPITADMTCCPNCGVELSFEDEDEEDAEEDSEEK
ncbi:MAG: transcription termination factor NusA [Spirochaetia bacterium]|nr:transcription termination factor NusA [Spirochaetia bacterium]